MDVSAHLPLNVHTYDIIESEFRHDEDYVHLPVLIYKPQSSLNDIIMIPLKVYSVLYWATVSYFLQYFLL
jgi:hypothetical protein